MLSLLLMFSGYVANSRDNTPYASVEPTLIAVVNRASWCQVCKANGDRAGAVLMSYTDKGLRVFINDLTDTASVKASEAALRKAHLYDAVYTSPRKGLALIMQHCGLLKSNGQRPVPTGIITFIDPRSHKRLKQVSIAIPDKEMKADIETMLK